MLLDAETLDLVPARGRGGRPPAATRASSSRCRRRSWRSSPRRTPRSADAAAELADARRDARRRGRRPLPRRGRGRAPVRVRHSGRSTRAPATRRSAPSTRRSPAASSSSACTCTSRSRAPTARSPSTTPCARTCPTSPRWPPTRRSTRAQDSGLASVRSRISGLLPRQGVPPALASFEAYAEALRWCGFDDPRQWWWELRLHPLYGTVEVRVPDTQATVADTARRRGAPVVLRAGAARHDAGEPLPSPSRGGSTRTAGPPAATGSTG